MGNLQESYKHRVQHLRGTSTEWNTPVGSEEETYGDVIVPLPGELVIEFDDTGNNFHKLKIGDGQKTYNELPYLSVDNFIMTKKYYIDIQGLDGWTMEDIDSDDCPWKRDLGDDLESTSDDRYYQIVKPYYLIDDDQMDANITHRSQINLQPTAQQLTIFHNKDLAFVVENWKKQNVEDIDDREVRVYCIGQIPIGNYTIQATITEVLINE